MKKTEHFLFLLVENFSHLAFSCAIEPLRIANLLSEKELYKWSFASENGADATCSNGAVTLVHHNYKSLPKADYLFVLSGIHVGIAPTTNLLAAIRHERAKGVQIGALCSAAYILAKAGILDGLRTSVHWEFHDIFLEEFPRVDLCRNVFVADEKIITASGGAASADLMLNLIERRHGADLATAVADQMVYTSAREATVEQRASIQSRYGMRNSHIVEAIRMMSEAIEDPVSPSVIAVKIGISTRQLERIFGRYLNCSPGKYYMDMRLQKAQRLLIQTELSVTDVGLSCGFGSLSHFSRVYRTHFNITPHMQLTKSR
jgi:transcriptional regulator GlxA family with amidase domain